jgi:hypothetical protein
LTRFLRANRHPLRSKTLQAGQVKVAHFLDAQTGSRKTLGSRNMVNQGLPAAPNATKLSYLFVDGVLFQLLNQY